MPYLTQKHIILIKTLMNSQVPLNGDVLSVSLGINIKTLKNYLDVVDEELSENAGANVILKSGKGIYLAIRDADKYNSYYQSFNFKYAGNKFLNSQHAKDSRYIARKLVFTERYLTIDDLVYELFKSRKSVLADIANAEGILRDYHLTVERKTGKGLICKGKESHKRLFIADYLIFDLAENPNEVYYKSYFQEGERTVGVLLDSFSHYRISISQKSVYKIARLILIGQVRKKSQLEEAYSHIEEIEEQPEYQCAGRIYQMLEIENVLPSEINFLTILIISRRYIDENEQYDIRNDKDKYEFAGRVIDYLFEKTRIDFTFYPLLRIALAGHLRGLWYRLRYGCEKKSIKTIETKQSNTFYEFAVIIAEFITEKWNQTVNDYEIAFLAYVFYYTKIQLQEPKKRRVLVLSSEGKEGAKIIGWNLLEKWSQNIESLTVENSYMLHGLSMSAYDLLVTDTPDLDTQSDILSVYVNNYFSKKDYFNLKKIFEDEGLNYQSFLSSFTPALFFPNMELSSKEEVMKFVASRLSEYFDKGVSVYDNMLKREQITSSEFNNSCAVMNSYTLFAKRPRIIIITLKRTINWLRNRVQLIVFVINGQNEQTAFSVLTIMRKVLNDNNIVYEMLHAANYADIVKKVRAWVSMQNQYC